jgi:TrmH family RNA methyltransferase
MAGENHTGQGPLETTSVLAMAERLQRDRHYRDAQAKFFVEGVRNFVAAIDHAYVVDMLLYSDRLLTAPVARMLVRRLKRAGVPFVPISPEQFRQISHTEHASGVAAILRQRVGRISHVRPDTHPCWIALGLLRSPGNLGSLIRTSAAVGSAGFLLLDNAVDPFDPAVVRASMGAFYRQQFVRTNVEHLRDWARRYAIPIVGASPDGIVDYRRMHYTRPTILMLGEERRGLSDEQRTLCEQLVRIPMVEQTDSLNLAVAGSLLLYEIFRSP